MSDLLPLRHPITRIFIALIMCVLCIAFITPYAQAKSNEKYASLVIDAETGKVLSSSYADKIVHPASLTKMMTLYMVFRELEANRLTMNSRISISSHAAAQPPSKIGLKPGQSIKVKDAIGVLVTKSANDIAAAVGEKISGSEDNFGRDMTKVARAMGMSKTTFKNASGLPNDAQVTTARDMAILARALLYHYPEHYAYFKMTEYTYNGQSYRSHNGMLKTFKGMDGIKTGFINASGFNLVGSATRDGRRIIGVVFGGRTWKSRNDHMAEIMDAGFNKIRGERPYIQEVAYKATKPQAILGQTESKVASTPVVNSVSSGASDGWSIQIGAFGVQAKSFAVAEAKARDLRLHYNGARANIVPFQSQQGTIYRARVIGLTQSQAIEACKTMASCLVVQPNG